MGGACMDRACAVIPPQGGAVAEHGGPVPDPRIVGMKEVLPLFDRLCPMHLWIAADGTVLHVGPTLQKLRASTPMPGQMFLDLFDVTRPRGVSFAGGLFGLDVKTLRFCFRTAPHTAFKGSIMPYGDLAIINLSFGISILDAVRDYALSSADFAATDMTIEMLYLIEAKSAAMEESRKLNLRLRGAMIAAEEQALTDTLTGLANRRALDQRLAGLQRAVDGFALMHLDLDHFKQVNDTLGHAAGDHVLAHVATILTAEVRRGDTVARVGGDEFILILPGLQDRTILAAIAQRIISRVMAPIMFEHNECRVGCSIGIVHSAGYECFDPAMMITDSDVALYAAKRRGRACHSFYPEEPQS